MSGTPGAAAAAPEPRRGGTFLYCWSWVYNVRPHEGHRKFRTAKAYRRHWRKQHAGDPQ